MVTPSLLTATPTGDVLELRPGGSWTAANVKTLEALSDSVTAQVDRSNSVKLDLAGVRELDALGAWLIEKMSRRATSVGHRADVVGVADKNRKVIASRLFEDSQKFDKVEPPTAITAFNDAFGRIAKDMVAWTVQAL